MKGANYGLT